MEDVAIRPGAYRGDAWFLRRSWEFCITMGSAAIRALVCSFHFSNGGKWAIVLWPCKERVLHLWLGGSYRMTPAHVRTASFTTVGTFFARPSCEVICPCLHQHLGSRIASLLKTIFLGCSFLQMLLQTFIFYYSCAKQSFISYYFIKERKNIWAFYFTYRRAMDAGCKKRN